MRRIDFHIEAGDSVILVGEDLCNAVNYLPEENVFIITDKNLRRIYENRFPRGVVFEIEPGEDSKNIFVAEKLCLALAEAGADRNSFLLGIGGGVVCDITGLVASLYMRGIRHGFISTSLLSQVDASTGGKTGVDAGNYKNIIGTFKLPEFVICDINMLVTLDSDEFISGLGEVIKSAAIADRQMFFELKSNTDLLLSRDRKFLEDIVYKSLMIKTSIVSADYRESGQRRLLNFGHTFGHALEMLNRVPHGVAVMQGMLLAAVWSVKREYLPESEYHELKGLVERLNIPEVVTIPAGFRELVQGDKKKSGDSLQFVFLTSLGSPKISKVKFEEIFKFLDTLS